MKTIFVNSNSLQVPFCFLKTFFHHDFHFLEKKVNINYFLSFYDTDKETFLKIVKRNKGFIFLEHVYFLKLKNIYGFRKDLEETFSEALIVRKLTNEELLKISFSFCSDPAYMTEVFCMGFWFMILFFIYVIGLNIWRWFQWMFV